MQDGITPAELHSKAFALYTQGQDWDQRSAWYAKADELVASGGEPDRGHGRKRAANWAGQIYNYENFWREHGRPRENTRDRATLLAEEGRLGIWATYQRNFESTLCQYQWIRLDISPAFVWDLHESGWQDTLDSCIEDVEKKGHLPNLNPADPTEFARARWFRRQLRHVQTGTLSRSRAERFAALLKLAKTT
ncbi:hypothetical protein [Cryobacterium sp. TMT2-4]|uniref:hypothetical protein n=1 Tax=Cryobacterium sp. TMT2-4 TaxID=1259254 RepID=UPI00106B679C|nr:hypothetical protein [Cryobacterium sp. TMT2-4]TFC67805.1 hypothetical protein E3O54_08320 [Cryobacterium sp. TMT2-4]